MISNFVSKTLVVNILKINFFVAKTLIDNVSDQSKN